MGGLGVTSETDEPVCFVAVYPEWLKATYMNLLSHHNVSVVASFQRSTFAFLPPDHWSSSLGGKPQARYRQLASDSNRDL